MTLRFKTNLLEHTKAVSSWSLTNNAKSFIDATTLALAVQCDSKTVQFAPQFVGNRPDDTLGYFPTLGKHCNGFVGWLPYPTQQWNISTSKLLFKTKASSLGLKTPARWDSRQNSSEPYIVKGDKSSFGYGISGPFKSDAAIAKLQQGEFLEAFKLGRIARAWYWAEQLAVLEMFPMPRIAGDGRSTLIELVQAAIGANAEPPAGMNDIAQFQGFELNDVIPNGRSLLADFRYVSPLNPTVYKNYNCLQQSINPKVREVFEFAGKTAWPLVHEQAKQPVAFVLDAIVDEKDDVWFLEINSNAQIHPDLYLVMLDNLFPS
jgi:hypothetical protein